MPTPITVFLAGTRSDLADSYQAARDRIRRSIADVHVEMMEESAAEDVPAASVYQRATRADMGKWYGRGQQGWYRYSSDNAGGAHFSGVVPESQVPAPIVRGP